MPVKALYAILSLVAISLIVVLAIPTFRTKVKNQFFSGDRKIISQIDSFISESGPRVKVLKVKSDNSIIVEIYIKSETLPESKAISTNDSETQVSRFILENHRDAFVQLENKTTNLALTDIDKDTALEVVVPAYDEVMAARLYIFKYNSATQTFDRVNN